MKRLILVIFAVIMFLGGCAYECNPNNYNWQGYNECGEYNPLYDIGRIETYVTKVISEPPGAKIELDNDYIGDTPLEIQWEGHPASGCFTRDHELQALPIHEGQYTQYKFFDSSLRGRRKIPKTIFFDMRLIPAPRRYEIDIE